MDNSYKYYLYIVYISYIFVPVFIQRIYKQYLNKQIIMKVSEKILENWNTYRAHGDVQKIHKETGHSATTISNAINSGEMSEEIFTAINNFYLLRSKIIRKGLQVK